MRFAFALVAILVAGGPAFAQHRHPPASYAGLQQRAVKALSAEQIADLRAGRGMSLALAAGLNGYPGPAHVLEQADALALTAQQRERTRTHYEGDEERGHCSGGAADRRRDCAR